MVNGPCPNCYDPHSFSTYANGMTETGYCQRCSHETQVPTKRTDPIVKVDVARPRPKPGSQKVRR
jgi:hypothetical protein